MKIYELVIMGSMLVACAAGIAWLFIDMNRQLKAFAERCESQDEE